MKQQIQQQKENNMMMSENLRGKKSQQNQMRGSATMTSMRNTLQGSGASA